MIDFFSYYYLTICLILLNSPNLFIVFVCVRERRENANNSVFWTCIFIFTHTSKGDLIVNGNKWAIEKGLMTYQKERENIVNTW